MDNKYQYTPQNSTWQLPIVAGLVLIGLTAALGLASDSKQFWVSYLMAFAFTLTILIGALMFVMIMTVAKAHWHVALRRIHETLAWGFPILAVFGLPILLFGMHDLYEWTHVEVVAEDHILQGKSGYLNMTFFTIRYVIYFFVWSWLALRLYKLSTMEDENADPSRVKIGFLTKLGLKMHMAGTGENKNVDFFLLRRLTSAWGVPISALCTAFASFDLLMSLTPHWFSTIFGVYFFAGGWVTSHAALLLLALYFYKNGKLEGTVNDEHFHDLGKSMFAFTVFWAYIGLSQMLLYWYANLPEETIYYRHRFDNYATLSWFIFIGKFLIPFLVTMNRTIKRKKEWLAPVALWFLIIHYVDIYFNTVPSIYPSGASFTWMNLTCLLGFVCFFGGLFFWKIRQNSLVPYNDAYFYKSLNYHSL
jgi:hypothetical protein